MKGWVYVISNKAMPSLVKVGFSMQDPELRAAELNHTGTPHPYVVEYEMLVDDPRKIEQSVHSRLSSEREGKEWFRCSAEDAIAQIQLIAGPNGLIENFKRTDRAKAEAIRHEIEQDEWAERAAEELRQQRVVALEVKRQEVISRYEPTLAAMVKLENFWIHFSGVFVLLLMVTAGIAPNMKDSGMLILSAIGAFIITPFVRAHFENRAKASAEYKAILAKREAELEAIDASLESVRQ